MKMIIKDSIVVYAGDVTLTNTKTIGADFVDTTTTTQNAFEVDTTPPRWFAPGAFTFVDGVFAALPWKLDEIKAELQQAVATARRKALDDGFMHNGILWDSDANARIAYAELAMRFQSDPTFVTTWKASEGYWVEMTAPLFQAVYAAGAEHVQTCFAWQAAKEVEINACQTVDELEAVVVTI